MIVYGHSYDRCTRTFVLHAASGTDPTDLLATYPQSEVGPDLLNSWLRDLETAVSSIQLSALEELSIPIASAEQMDWENHSSRRHKSKVRFSNLSDEQVILAASFWSL